MGVKVRYATKEDVRKFHDGKDAKMSFRGVVIAEDDDIIAIGGVFRDARFNVAFSEFKPGALKHKKAIVKAAGMAMELVKKHYNQVITVVLTDAHKTSDSFITHYGFEKIPGVPGGYIWRRT